MKLLLFILSIFLTTVVVAQVDQATSSVFTQGDLAQRIGTKDGVQMKVGGLATIGDGGGGTFRWDATATDVPVPGKVIQPVIGGNPLPAGRWILVLQAQTSIAGLSDSLAAIRSSSGNTTIISSGGNALTIRYTANGLKDTVKLYTGNHDSTTVVSVQSLYENGSGIQGWLQNGDTTYIFYGDAPDSIINYKIGIIGALAGGGHLPDTLPNNPPPDTLIGGGNSRWTYVLDTSCQIKYGILPGLGTTANQIALANMALTYVRIPYNGGATVNYPSYTGAYKVLLNYNTLAPVIGNYTTITTDTVNYRNTMKTFLQTNGVSNLLGIASYNEWNNIQHGQGYWNPGSAQNMINHLRAAGNVAHEMGVKFYDGGITGDIMLYMVWEDLKNRGFTDSAADYAARAFKPGVNLNGWRTDTSHGYKIRYTDSVLTAMPGLPLDGVNMHYYETVLDADSSDASINQLTFLQVVRYLYRKTGKPVITTEFGTNNNTNPDIMSQLVDAVETLHDAKNGDMSIAIWNANNLLNSDGSLNDFGAAFRDKIKETHVDQ